MIEFPYVRGSVGWLFHYIESVCYLMFPLGLMVSVSVS